METCKKKRLYFKKFMKLNLILIQNKNFNKNLNKIKYYYNLKKKTIHLSYLKKNPPYKITKPFIASNRLIKLFKNTHKKLQQKMLKKKKLIRRRIIQSKYHRIKIFKKKRRNKKRKFWRGFKWKRKKIMKKYLYHLRKKKRNQKYQNKCKFNNRFLTIKIRRKNTFFSLYTKDVKKTKKLHPLLRMYKKIYKKLSKKKHPKTRKKIEKKYLRISRTNKYIFKISKKNKLLTTQSLGKLGYTGRHKTSPVAKKSFGQFAGKFIMKNNFSYLDIILQKKIGRLYKPFLKGLASYRFTIRRILVNKIHPHGFIRARKKKRK